MRLSIGFSMGLGLLYLFIDLLLVALINEGKVIQSFGHRKSSSTIGLPRRSEEAFASLLEASLKPPWSLLGASCSVLSPLGALRKSSREPLGPSLELPGAS